MMTTLTSQDWAIWQKSIMILESINIVTRPVMFPAYDLSYYIIVINDLIF